MRENKNYEQGHTNPFITMAIVIIIGMLGYLGFDSMNPDTPSTITVSSMYTTWLGWSWWAKGLSIVSPISLLLIGSRLDNASGFGELPSDDEMNLRK